MTILLKDWQITTAPPDQAEAAPALLSPHGVNGDDTAFQSQDGDQLGNRALLVRLLWPYHLTGRAPAGRRRPAGSCCESRSPGKRAAAETALDSPAASNSAPGPCRLRFQEAESKSRDQSAFSRLPLGACRPDKQSSKPLPAKIKPGSDETRPRRPSKGQRRDFCQAPRRRPDCCRQSLSPSGLPNQHRKR
jgi:hypothetical protein